MKFSIIIATCGRPERLRTTLNAVAAACDQSGGGHELIVVDNGPDHSAEPVVAAFDQGPALRLHYLRSVPRNKSAALNVGVAAAEHEWMAFTDDDTLPDASWLCEAAEYAADCGARVFGGRIVPAEKAVPLPPWLRRGRSGRIAVAGTMVRYEPLRQSGILKPSDPVPFGANVFIHRDVFAAHGTYDEDLWVLCGKAALGVDDGEFGVRLAAQGEPIGYCHSALVTHPLHETRFSVASHLRIAYRYGWRDPLVFVADYAHPMIPFRFKVMVGHLGLGLYDLVRRDPAGALHHAVESVRNLGRVTGRLSHAYRVRRNTVREATMI